MRFDHENEPASSSGTALASQTALALTAPASQTTAHASQNTAPGPGIAFVPSASERMLMPNNARSEFVFLTGDIIP